MFGKENINTTSKGDENYITPIIDDKMFKKFMKSKSAMPFIEAIISQFSKDPIEKVKNNVKLILDEDFDIEIPNGIVTKYNDTTYIIEKNDTEEMLDFNCNRDFNLVSSSFAAQKEFPKIVIIYFNNFKTDKKNLYEEYLFINRDSKTNTDNFQVYVVNMLNALKENIDFAFDFKKENSQD